jgi:hypothetical protein
MPSFIIVGAFIFIVALTMSMVGKGGGNFYVVHSSHRPDWHRAVVLSAHLFVSRADNRAFSRFPGKLFPDRESGVAYPDVEYFGSVCGGHSDSIPIDCREGDALPPKLADLSRWGRDAYLSTVEHIRPGMRGCDIFKLAEKEIYRQDFNQVVPIDFVGHGIGLLNHETPWFAPDDLTELQPNMVVCVEVGCFDNQQVFLGNMPEDMYLVTENGLERLGIDVPRDVMLCG